MATKPAEKKQETAVSKVVESSVILQQDTVPDYINQDKARGSENVTTGDLVIPRLEVIQGLSPAVKPGDPGFIQGAVQGMLNNSVTRQLYGDHCHVIPVYFTVQYLVWRDRKRAKELGIEQTGFFGAFNTTEEAYARLHQEDPEETKALEVVDTPQHLCLVLNPDTGTCDEIMLSMPRTKAKVSRQWNSMIKLAGGDRFGRVYKVSSVLQKNAQGDFYNFHMEQVGFPALPAYRQAEELYKAVRAGDRQMMMDTSDLNHGEGTTEGENAEY